jgi:hypothetical protein
MDSPVPERLIGDLVKKSKGFSPGGWDAGSLEGFDRCSPLEALLLRIAVLAFQLSSFRLDKAPTGKPPTGNGFKLF